VRSASGSAALGLRAGNQIQACRGGLLARPVCRLDSSRQLTLKTRIPNQHCRQRTPHLSQPRGRLAKLARLRSLSRHSLSLRELNNLAVKVILLPVRQRAECLEASLHIFCVVHIGTSWLCGCPPSAILGRSTLAAIDRSECVWSLYRH